MKTIICPECEETIRPGADVCIGCGHPNNERNEKLSEENVKIIIGEKKVISSDLSREYELDEVRRRLHSTEMDIGITMIQTYIANEDEFDGEQFSVTLIDPNGNECMTEIIKADDIIPNISFDMYIRADIDVLGTYTVMVEIL